MKAYIFAEGSNTTADSPDTTVKEYYQGLFGMIAGLTEELEDFAESKLYVFSEDHGILEGNESFVDARESHEAPVGKDKMVNQAQAEMLRAAETADVMVVLLSTDVFRSIVTPLWDELVDEAKPGSIWCLGAARSALDELDTSALEAKGCTVLTYRRVGVARIGTETRTELLEIVKQKTDQ